MSINLDALISYIYKMAFVGKSIMFPQEKKEAVKQCRLEHLVRGTEHMGEYITLKNKYKLLIVFNFKSHTVNIATAHQTEI